VDCLDYFRAEPDWNQFERDSADSNDGTLVPVAMWSVFEGLRGYVYTYTVGIQDVGSRRKKV
jgi:hypothetical protein